MNNPTKEFITRIGHNFQSPPTRVVITLGVVGAYIVMFALLYPFGGMDVAALSLIPVTVAAWLFGLRVGLIGSLLSLLLNTLLFNLVGYQPGGLYVILYTGGIPDAIVTVLIGMIVGRLRDLSDQLKQQLAEREQIEASLRQSTESHRRLAAAEREQRLLAETLGRVGLALNSTLELSEVLDLICRESINLFQVEAAFIWLVQGEELIGYAGQGRGQENFLDMRIPISDTNTLGPLVVREMRPIFVNEAVRSDLINPKLVKLFQIEAILGVPLSRGGKALGALMIIDTYKTQRFGQDDVKIAETLGNYAAIAIQNAQLFDAEARRRHEAEVLYQSTLALTSALDLEGVLDNILTQLEQVVPYDSSAVFLRMEDRLQVVGAKGFADLSQVIGKVYPINDALFDEIRRTQQPLILSDAQADPRFQQWGNSSHVHGWMGVPLIVQEKAIGCLTLDSRQMDAYSQVDAILVQTFASQAAVAIANAQLFEQIQLALVETQALHHISSILIGFEDLSKLLQTVADEMAKTLPATWVALVRLDLQAQQVLDIVVGGPETHITRTNTFEELMTGLTGWVVREKKPALSPKGKADPRESLEVQQNRADNQFGSVIVVPLQYQKNILGTLTAVNRLDKPDFTQREVNLMVAMANQAAVAIVNTQLFEQTQVALAQSEALYQTTRTLITLTDLPEMLQSFVDRVAETLPANRVSLYIVDIQIRQIIEVVIGGPGGHNFVPLSFDGLWGGLGGWTLRRLEPVISLNGECDPRQSTDMQQRRSEAKAGAIIAIPLLFRDNVLGTMIAVNRIDEPDFTSQDVELMTVIANQAAIAIENAHLFKATQEAHQLSDALREIEASITATLDIEEVLIRILDGLGKVIPYTSVSLMLEESNFLRIKAARGLSDDSPAWSHTFVVDEKRLDYKIYKTKKPLIIPDVYQDPDFVKLEGSEYIRSWLGVPLIVRDQVIGILNIDHDQPNFYTEEHTAIASAFAHQAAIAIQNARLYEKVQQHTAQLEARVAERTFKLQALYELAHKLGHATQLGDVIRLTLLEISQILPHDIAASLLLTDTKNILVMQSQHTLTPHIETQIREKLMETITPLRDRTINEKILEIHRIQPRIENDLQPPLKNLGSVMTAPIFIGNAAGSGLLLVATKQEGQFNEAQKQLLHIVANQAADTMGRLQSLLAAEYQRLENLVAHLPSGIIMLNAEQQVVLANPLAQKWMHGLTTIQVGDRLTQLGEYSIETILNPRSTDDPPLTLVPKNLPSRLLEIVAKPITTGFETGGCILLLRDVTEERGIQRRIQQQERMAAVGQLAAGIAHDFNNILTSIIGYAELLLLDPSLSPSSKDDVARITKQGQRAAHLVRQILDFSRQTISTKQSLNLLPFVQETIKLLERIIREDIHISLEAELGNYEILGDLTQIQQALTNLAINARDAMPAGGNLRFQLSRVVLHPGEESPDSELSPGDWIALAVSDTGIGIAPELHRQIFEPFFTTKEVGEGTGLGLAQVYGIMRQHDGHIGVKSRSEIGTTFSLYFPALLTSEPSSQEIITELPRGDNELILLVEDDLAVLTITTTMLQHLGYRVLTATNGNEALEVYNKHQSKIKLVLTDMTMPQMGGAELIAALRKRNPAIKVVVLTGYPQKEIGKAKLTQGIVDWLHKPLSVENLAYTISRSLNLEEETS